MYLTARPGVRAERRYNQLKNKGISVELEALIQDVEQRDARDASRKASPLKPASDALIVDNSDLDAVATFEMVLQAVRKIL